MLAQSVARRQPVTNFSMAETDKALRAELRKLVADKEGNITHRTWEQGKFDLFDIITETIDIMVPEEIDRILYEVAEIKHYNNGDKPRFQVNTSNLEHLKRFVTKVARAGVYERTRLDVQYIDVEIYQHGGAIYQSWEDVLVGRGDIGQLFSDMLVALEHSIFDDVATALEGLEEELPSTLKVEGSFDMDEFHAIGMELKPYGNPTIYCTEVFAAKYLSSEPGIMSELEKLELRNQGYTGMVKGMPVVVLPANTSMKSNKAYIIPSGTQDKPIKIAYEGDTQIRDSQRESWELEIQFYKKAGVAVVNAANKLGVFVVTD